MVDSNDESETSVQALTQVSPSMAKKGKRNRRAARHISTPYDATTLRRSMRLTLPPSKQKFDPYRSVDAIVAKQYKQFKESVGKHRIYIDSIKAGKKFFRLLEDHAQWIEDAVSTTTPFIFSSRCFSMVCICSVYIFYDFCIVSIVFLWFVYALSIVFLWFLYSFYSFSMVCICSVYIFYDFCMVSIVFL